MQRNWTTVGEEYVERLGRGEVEQAIAELEWQEIPRGGSVTVGFMPGAAINHAIRELALPKVTAFAISAFERPAASPDEDGFYPGFYGIRCFYKDGRCHVYALDTGSMLHPLASDFWTWRELAEEADDRVQAAATQDEREALQREAAEHWDKVPAEEVSHA